jgi:predicted TIM-barrel fold metal-dependent hydrolase
MTSVFTPDPIAIVDVDSHLTEPPGLWVDHAPARFKDRVLRVVENDDGRPVWVVDGQPYGPIGNTLVGPDGEKIQGERSTTTHRKFEELHKGAYDLTARLQWLDGRGIHQQIIFPNIPGFGAARFARQIEDVELRTACVTAYNDAAAEMWRDSGHRLMPLALVPFWDIDTSVREVRRIRTELDLHGITMCDNPGGYGFPSLDDPAWAPFWSACEDLGVAVAFHIGSAAMGPAPIWNTTGGEAQAILTVNSFLSNSWVVTNLIFSGVLLRHPRLKVFSAESGIGWIPFLLEAMDYQWHENLTAADKRNTWGGMTPSEVFRRNIYVSYWFEQFGPRQAMEAAGVDNVMFETDFPHGTALTDRSTAQVAATLAGFSPEVRRKVLRDNAARLYDLD